MATNIPFQVFLEQEGEGDSLSGDEVPLHNIHVKKTSRKRRIKSLG